MNHNEYFYGKKSEVVSPVKEVLKHNFASESLNEVKQDYMTLKEEEQKIKEVRQKLQNIIQVEPDFTSNKLSEEEYIIAQESEEEIHKKFKEAERALEDKNTFIKIAHTIERWLKLRA